MTKRTAIILGGLAGGAALLAASRAVRQSQTTLSGEVVLITGGSRGLGLALAREFAARGCAIALCARDVDELGRAAQDLRSDGTRVFASPCDVSDPASVARMIAAVTAHYGRIDILVNNAGIIDVGPAESWTLEDFQQSMNTMFWGTVHPTLAVLPAFHERRSGRIVNIASIGGKVSVPHLLPYSSAKFAVAGFSEGLAAELRPHGITVTTIYPGLMRTGSFVQARFKGKQAQEADWFTLGATLPGISMSARRAARHIVDAVENGIESRVLSLPAKALAEAHDLFPNTVISILGLASRFLLPSSARSNTKASGRDLLFSLHPLVRAIASWSQGTMRNYNQTI